LHGEFLKLTSPVVDQRRACVQGSLKNLRSAI
jgi:hypothetical protein